MRTSRLRWNSAGGASPRVSRAVPVFFALLFVVYTCLFPYMARMNNPNENVRTYMTMALVEEHTVRIDKMVARYGWVNDMALVPDKKTGEAHRASVKGPAISYLGLPFYWAFWKLAPHFKHPQPAKTTSVKEHNWWFRSATLVLRIFTVQLPCFAFLVWLERWLRATTSDTVLRLTAVAAVGLGTNYLAYSMMFASHAPFAVAAFGAFAVTTSERMRVGGKGRMPGWLIAVLFLVGAAMGAGALKYLHIELSHKTAWLAVPLGLGTLLSVAGTAMLPPV